MLLIKTQQAEIKGTNRSSLAMHLIKIRVCKQIMCVKAVVVGINAYFVWNFYFLKGRRRENMQ